MHKYFFDITREHSRQYDYHGRMLPGPEQAQRYAELLTQLVDQRLRGLAECAGQLALCEYRLQSLHRVREITVHVVASYAHAAPAARAALASGVPAKKPAYASTLPRNSNGLLASEIRITSVAWVFHRVTLETGDHASYLDLQAAG